MTYGKTKTGKFWRRWKKAFVAATILLMMGSFAVTAAYSGGWQVVSVAARSSYAAAENDRIASEKQIDVEVGGMTFGDDILSFTVTCRYDGEVFPGMEDISGVCMQYTGVVGDDTQHVFRFDSETAGTERYLSAQDNRIEESYQCRVYAPELAVLSPEERDCRLAVVLIYYDEQTDSEGRSEYLFDSRAEDAVSAEL